MIEAISLEGSNSAPAEISALPHVLLVIDQLPKTMGGGERVALKLAALLPNYGFRPSILTFFVHPECSELASAPCPIYLLRLKRTYDFTAVRGAFALRKLLQKERVQLVQTFFESSDLWAGFITKTLTDAKLIWSRRDMGILRGRKHGLGYRLMSAMPDSVFAVSEQVRRHCIEIDGIDPARVETVYNGLDLAQWRSGSAPLRSAGKIIVTTVGNIRRVKGHDLMIRAAADIVQQFPGVSFSIAGAVLEPDYFEDLQSLVNKLGLAGSFHFLGGACDLQRHLTGADIFVLPSRSEGFSNAIIEAMAAGLPVVATGVGGNAEAVEDGISGLIVPPEDPDALTKALAKLLADPARAKAMGKAGREIVAKKFTIEAMMSHIASTYRRLLEES